MLICDVMLMDGTGTIRPHQNLWIKGREIAYIGCDIPQEAHGDAVYKGSGKAVLPGFYNMHSHVPMTLLRGFGEGLPLERWLHEKIFPFEVSLTAEDLYWGALLGIAEMLACGTVSFTDMYLNTDRVYDAVDESGIKANLSSSAQDSTESRLHYRELPAYRHTNFLMERVKEQGHDRIRAEMAVHAEYTTTEQIVREAVEFAAENGLSVHLHLAETQQECTQCIQRHGASPVVWFDRLGAFELPATAAHCVWLAEEDRSLLRDRRVTVAHCPASNLKLGSGIAPVAGMLEEGIRVTIGTDGAASNNNLDLWKETYLASLLQKGNTHDPMVCGPQEMLRCLTENGAAAQRRSGCGRLQEGFRADLTVVDLERPNLQPLYDPGANILYAAHASDVVMTMVDGKVLYQDGEYRTIDLERILYQVRKIAAKRGASV